MSKYPNFDDQQDMLKEPTMSYNESVNHATPVSGMSTREKLKASTMSVDEYFDELINQVRHDTPLASPKNDASQEDLLHAIEQDPELTLKPSVIEADGSEAIDLETFRADLHKMVGTMSSRERALDRDMTPEELYAIISEEIDDIYANG